MDGPSLPLRRESQVQVMRALSPASYNPLAPALWCSCGRIEPLCSSFRGKLGAGAVDSSWEVRGQLLGRGAGRLREKLGIALSPA
jgi:hypothetical protein